MRGQEVCSRPEGAAGTAGGVHSVTGAPRCGPRQPRGSQDREGGLWVWKTGRKEILGHNPEFSEPRRKDQGHPPAWPALRTASWPGNRPPHCPRAPEVGVPEKTAGHWVSPSCRGIPGARGQGGLRLPPRVGPRPIRGRPAPEGTGVPWWLQPLWVPGPSGWHLEEAGALASSLSTVSETEMIYPCGKFGEFPELRALVALPRRSAVCQGFCPEPRAGKSVQPCCPQDVPSPHPGHAPTSPWTPTPSLTTRGRAHPPQDKGHVPCVVLHGSNTPVDPPAIQLTSLRPGSAHQTLGGSASLLALPPAPRGWGYLSGSLCSSGA